MNEVYQELIVANFEDDSNWENIPEDGHIILEIPAYEPQSPGTASLHDLEGLLHPYDKGYAADDAWAGVDSMKRSDGSPITTMSNVRIGRCEQAVPT